MKKPLILAAALAALAPLAIALLHPGPARGEEPVSVPAGKAASPEETVASLMTELRANEGAVRVGMVATKAGKATAGAAKHIDQRYLPLKGSWLDPDGLLLGTVDWDTDLDTGNRVDSICVVLLAGSYDRSRMEKAIVAAGKKCGLALEPDEEDPDTWFDYQAKGTELWITLGDGIVVVEAEAAD